MQSPYDTIKGMLRTEKGSALLPLNKYIFWVARNSNKLTIKKAIEDIYKVKVESVNTAVVRGKMRRVRYAAGMTSTWKKAIVTLEKGSKIDVT